MTWPASEPELTEEQLRLATEEPPCWAAPARISVGACFICFPRGMPAAGPEGEPCWAGAAVVTAGHRVLLASASGFSRAPYRAGMLALREGPLLERAVRGLRRWPDVLLVNATGRDHPRRAGLALHLGAVLGLPTVGVTHRPLLAQGVWPPGARGDAAPLLLGGEPVGAWLRTRSGVRPLAVHAAWRTDVEIAIAVVLAASRGRVRTPNPLRHARRVARRARTAAQRRERGVGPSC
ncbi:MAG: endonuclease V [Thermoanaerobaculia bacterium]|nr:endonuclease V [Thermoanaerobaculia bacterium]